jgi:hypothetical protein
MLLYEAKASLLVKKQQIHCFIHRQPVVLRCLDTLLEPSKEAVLEEWVHHYNHERYHKSLDNVTPADVFRGRWNEILDQRAP